MKGKAETVFSLEEISELELHVLDDALCRLIQPGPRTATLEEKEVAERIFKEIRYLTHHLTYPVIFRTTTDGSGGHIEGKDFVPAPVKEENRP